MSPDIVEFMDDFTAKLTAATELVKPDPPHKVSKMALWEFPDPDTGERFFALCVVCVKCLAYAHMTKNGVDGPLVLEGCGDNARTAQRLRRESWYRKQAKDSGLYRRRIR